MENKDFKKLIETSRQVMSTDESLTEEKLLLEHEWKWPFLDPHDRYSKEHLRQHKKEFPNHPGLDHIVPADAEQQQSADRIANAQKAIANFVSQSQQNTQQK